jgi:aspartate aminotransferase
VNPSSNATNWTSTCGTKDAVERLGRARRVLLGIDSSGNKVRSGMFDANVISFAHGEGIRRPHPAVIASGIRLLLDNRSGALENYLFLQRFADLDREVSRSFQGFGIPSKYADNICIDAGTTRLFYGFFHAMTKPGDIVVTAPGHYHSLARWCDLSGVELFCVPTTREMKYKITPECLANWYDRFVLRGVCKPPKALVLFNPTYLGAVYSSCELERLANVILERDLTVIEDGIFAETIFDPQFKFVHLASIHDVADRVITVSGGSKAYGLANLRIGWACGPRDIIQQMNDHTVATMATVPQIAKVMAAAALQAPRSYLQENAQECHKRSKSVTSIISEISYALTRVESRGDDVSISVAFEPQAGHSMLVCCQGFSNLVDRDGNSIRDSVDLARALLCEARVAVSPAISLGFNEYEFRLTFGCVGLDETYNDLEEGWYMKKVLSGHLNGEANVRSEREADFGKRGNIGFKPGRELIQDALVGRVLPALVGMATRSSRADCR